MKKILLSIVTVVLFTLLLSTASITVHAEGDELHVIGLPEGENGYTLPGWYGDID